MKNILLKKCILLKLLIGFNSIFCFSQVGIGTTTPQSTLDITGNPTSTTTLDGVIPPKINWRPTRGKNLYRHTNWSYSICYRS